MTGWDENTTRRQRERETLDKRTQVKTHKHNGNSDNLNNRWVRRPILWERYMNQRKDLFKATAEQQGEHFKVMSKLEWLYWES